MFQIVAFDLDGTLLSPDHRVGIFTKQTLLLLISRGIHIVFATGRHHVNVIKICESLNISVYMITSNGSRVHDDEGRLIFSYNFKENIASELLDIVYRDPKIITNVFRNDEWFVSRDIFNQKDVFGEFNFCAKVYKQGFLSTHGICKIYFTSDDYQHLLDLERLLNYRWGSNVINVSFSLPLCLEVVPGGISKGYALEAVVNLLGYDLQDCISFGDGMNDREMLTMTGKGCIMGNAQQRLKDSLPLLEVIGTNQEEAVSHYLRSMYLTDVK